MIPQAARTPASAYWLRADAIGRILDDRAWSQSGLATDVGLHRVSLSRYIHRHRPVGPRSRGRLLRWAAANGIAPETLLERRPPVRE